MQMNFQIVGAFEKKPHIVWIPGQYDIICHTCKHKVRVSDEEQYQFITGGFVTTSCPNCHTPYSIRTEPPPVNEGSAFDGLMTFGRTVRDVIGHRNKAEDIDLDANVHAILSQKLQREGLTAFSNAERFVYSVQQMSSQVNNGGFYQFFSEHSGALAFDLVPALKAMGFVENLAIAKEAIKRFGKPPSLDDDDRWKHLSKITEDGEKGVWEDLDSRFYENPEDIETMTLT